MKGKLINDSDLRGEELSSVDVGPICVALTGSHPVVSLLVSELDAGPRANKQPDIEFGVEIATPVKARERVLSRKRRVFSYHIYRTGEGLSVEYRIRGGPLVYRISFPTDHWAPRRVTIELPRWLSGMVGRVMSPLVRMISRDGASLMMTVAKNLVYELIDPLVWLRLTEKGATFVHASAVINESGEAVVLASTGGVGKSTALLELMSDTRWDYLADDLLILGSDGMCWRHPKKLQVYGYNIELVPRWKFEVRGRSPVRTAWWSIRGSALGGHQVRRRMSPERLFGKDRVANSAAISRFLWLSPSDGETPTYGPATTSNLATLALNAYADEVWEFLQLLNLAGLSSDSEIARLNDLFARTFSILSQGIGCAAHGVLRVPHRSAESLALLIDHLDRS